MTTAKKSNWSIRRRMILLLIPAIIIVLLIATLFSLQLSSAAEKNAAYDNTRNSARAYAHEFDTGMSDNLAKSRTFSSVLSHNSGMTRQDVLDIQHTLLEYNPNAIGIGVIFEPGAFDGQDVRYANTPGHDATGRFASYWNRLNGTESLIPIVDIETSDWYTIPKTTRKEIVMEPQPYENVLMTSYITPIIKNETFAGTVGIDVALENIDRTVSQVKVFDTGYAFLVSNSGIFVSSPKKEYIGRMSLNELSREKNNPNLAAMAVDIHEGKEGYAEMTDPFTGKNVVMFYSPIETGNWSMVVVAPTNEMLAGVAQLASVLLLIGLFSIVVVGTIIIIVARNLSEPIVAMSRTADRIASGDLEVHVPEQEGELGVLANAFNNMTTSLKNTRTLLLTSHSELEQENARRKLTESDLERKNLELMAANEQLAAAEEELKGQFDALVESERMIRENEERFRTIIKSMLFGIVIIDAETHKIIEANPKALEMIGGTSESVIGSLCHSFICPAELGKCPVTDLEQTVDSSERVILNMRGEKIPILKSVIKTMLGGKEVLIESFINITDRKLAEDTILKVNQKLNVLSQLTRQDLTTQIFVLNSFLEMAKKQATGQDGIIKNIESGERAVRSIKEITEFTKDYHNMGEKPPKWQNVKLAFLFGLSHISIGDIRHSLETENLEIFADPLLEKAFQGLLENSVEHGGHVSRIRVWHNRTPDGVTILFENDGIGIPVDKKERIFLRGEGSRASVRGLFFVREILDITGITIRETGEPGKGARFEMIVPKGAWRMTGKGA